MPVLTGIAAPATGSLLGFIDVGSGVLAGGAVLVDTANNDVLGLVSTTPNANSVLGRLKAIADAVTAQSAYVDGLEALATTLNGYVDTLETLIGSSNTLITTQNSYVDGLETALATLNATLTAQSAYMDNVEALLTALAPAGGGVAITPNDATALTGIRSLWVGGAGTLVMDFPDGSSNVTMVGVPGGSFLPVAPSKVKVATTASLIIGFK